MNLPGVEIDAVVLSGGMDQVTPTLSLKNGLARHSLNFECAPTGGYSRIKGYERFDGRPAPSSAANVPTAQWFISMLDSDTSPAVGETVTASDGASGVVKSAYPETHEVVDAAGETLLDDGGTAITVDCDTLELICTTGNPFVELTTVGGKAITLSVPGDDSPSNYAANKDYVSDSYRNSITAVPGSGPIRGVFEYNDTVYALRNAADNLTVVLYKSTSTGWAVVPLFYSVAFTAGTTEPTEGATLTQGGKTATIKRVVRSSGAWTGSAAGKIIITAPTGGDFAAGAATSGTSTLTLSGAQSAIALSPSGKFEFVQHNFGGQEKTTRIYGCDGKNKLIEFDGTVLVPIATGASVDRPTHLTVHRNYLFASIGSSVMYSAPGDPYDWSAIGGAGEITIGATVTGIRSMPGGTGTATLGITSRDNTAILYGNGPDDWNLVNYNVGTGAAPFSLVNMSQTLAFDDRGANSIQASLQYGNFSQTALTNSVRPFVLERVNKLAYATVCRASSQYRIYFSDGYGLHITLVNGKLLGCMPVYFPNPVCVCYEGKTSTGEDVIYFGSDNGFVYQMEKGASFDGAAIDYQLVLNYTNARGPRTKKRFRRASVEIVAEPNTYVEFDLNSILGYDSVEYAQPMEVAKNAYIGASRWDTFTWDNFYWDTHGLQPIDCPLEGTAENIALVFSGSSDKCDPFTINSILIHYTPRRMMR